MRVRTLHRSFVGGEISPEMQGGVTDKYYLTGLHTCENFIVKPQGPVENRPGTKYVNRVKDHTKVVRLIPFTFSTTETMIVELGNQYIRLHTNGASLPAGDPVAAWVTATAYEVGDVVVESGTNYYCITAHTSSAAFATDSAKWYAMPATGEYEFPSPYTSDADLDSADIFTVNHVQSEDVLTLTHPGYAPRELRRLGIYQWELITIDFSAGLGTVTGVAAAGYSKATSPRDTTPPTDTDYEYEYVVTALDVEQNYQGVASASATVDCNLNSTGHENKITWSANVAGAVYYNVYKKQGGLYGFIGQTTELFLWDNNIAPDMTYSPPVYDTDPLGGALFTESDSFPGAVSYFEQRRVFAGTNDALQTVWMTKPASESNMSYSLPTVSDDRINFRIAAREANTVRHVVPLNKLLLLTSSAVWVVDSVSGILTPASVSVRPQSYLGASRIQPAIINTTLVYPAAKGGHLIECGYDFKNSSFVSGDLCLRAGHLFDEYNIVGITYARSPNPIVWAVSSSGKLLGFTYIPEHALGAWHKHTTDGEFESCAVVSEGTEDALYVVVKRTIEGSDVRYVERLNTRRYATLKDAFFVDCGLTYEGRNIEYSVATLVGNTNFGPAVSMTLTGGSSWGPDETLTLTCSSAAFLNPVSTDLGDEIVLVDNDPDSATYGQETRLAIESTASTTVATVRPDQTVPVTLRSTAIIRWEFARDTFSGLDHLEDEIVNVLGDGAVYPQETVSSGAITIDPPAAVVHIGMPYNCDLKTLPLVAQVDDALAQGRTKNVNKAWIKVYRSSGIFVGPNEDNLIEAKQRKEEPYGDPPDLKTDDVPIVLTPTWASTGSIFMRQSDPLPLTATGIILEVSLGE